MKNHSYPHHFHLTTFDLNIDSQEKMKLHQDRPFWLSSALIHLVPSDHAWLPITTLRPIVCHRKKILMGAHQQHSNRSTLIQNTSSEVGGVTFGEIWKGNGDIFSVNTTCDFEL